jgi:hypothetical protein
MVTEIQLFESPDLTPLDFLGGWMKSEIKKKFDIQDEFFALIWNAATRIKKREDQLRRTTRDLRTRVAKCNEVDGGIFEYLL